MDPKLIYRRVSKYLDDRNWTYNPHDDKLIITLSVKGEDIPVELLIHVSDEQKLLKIISFLPFKVAEDKRVDMAIAACAINNQLANGNFDIDIDDGTILFRVAVPFDGGLPDESIHYLIGVTCITVDEYNDKLLMLNKGMWTIEDLIKNI